MMPDDKTTLPPTDAAEQLLDQAEASGKLKPIEDVLKSEGADISARDAMKYAQFDDRTRTKPPEELAAMLAEDPSLIADIVAEMEKQEGSEMDEGMEPPKDANSMMEERMKHARAAEMPSEE
jgi:hypothetical protein